MFNDFITKYENELYSSVIPFWEKNCIDKECGGYFTMLDRDGSIYDTEKYMWMQWRIVYMFALLYDETKLPPAKAGGFYCG
jgi:N-acylglucosamine 2-epimerase